MRTEDRAGHIVGDPFALATISIAYVCISLYLDTMVIIGERLKIWDQ